MIWSIRKYDDEEWSDQRFRKISKVFPLSYGWSLHIKKSNASNGHVQGSGDCYRENIL
jgi:hypothetical protein